MSGFLLYGSVSIALLGIGLHGLLARTHLVRKIMALNVIGTAVFLLLVAVASRGAEGPDPVPHAMVLTGIVVAVSVTATALALARRIHAETGAPCLVEEEGLE